MDINKVGLRETLEALRVELSKSILASEGEQIRFQVGEIELEVQFVVEKSKDRNFIPLGTQCLPPKQLICRMG